jgi:hypothetical protein
MTTGFLAALKDGEKMAQLVGVKWPLQAVKDEIASVAVADSVYKLPFPMKTDYRIIPDAAEVLLKSDLQSNHPFLVSNKERTIYIINTHTFSEEDFAAVGEHLLAPRQIGIVELPSEWAGTIREAFRQADEPVVNAPARVSVQQLKDGSLVIHNYNQAPADVTVTFTQPDNYKDGFTGEKVATGVSEVKLKMQARSNIWLIPVP